MVSEAKTQVHLRLHLLTTLFVIATSFGGSLAAQDAASSTQSTERVQQEPENPTGQKDLAPDPVDAIAPYRKELLTRAFAAASMIPIQPHVKDRSRTQEQIVATCLELDETRLALQFMEQINNWRRGACYADFAAYCAANDRKKDVQRFLILADMQAEKAESWRRDRILFKIARVNIMVGRSAEASGPLPADAQDEAGRLEGVALEYASKAEAREVLPRIANIADEADFSRVQHALKACTILFDRFYDDEPLREQLFQTVIASWDPLPISVRLQLLNAFTHAAVEHGDFERAKPLVDEAWAMMTRNRWIPGTQIKLMASIIFHRARSGDTAQASADAQAAMELYERSKHQIPDIEHADLLRPLAIAYQAMGDHDAALRITKLALEAGAANPNARPRAEDLALTCAAMAQHAIEPDDSCWTLLNSINQGLNAPW